MQAYTIEVGRDYDISEEIRGLCARDWELVMDLLTGILKSAHQRGAEDGGRAEEAVEDRAQMAAELRALRNEMETQRAAIIAEEREKAAELLKRFEMETSDKLRALEASTINACSRDLAAKDSEISELKNGMIARELEILSKAHEKTAELIAKMEKEHFARIREIESSAEEKFMRVASLDRSQFFESFERLAAQRITENPQIAATESKLNTIIDSLKPITRHYTGNNSEKGISGEVSIYNILTSDGSFEDALVEDVSGTAASGDILFTWNKVKCMIEVKNKQKITQADLSKFERDVTKLAEEEKINCAMFISLDGNRLPGKTKETIQIEYMGNTPVVFLHSPPPSNEVCVVLKMVDKLIKSESLDKQNELSNNLIECCIMTSNLKQYFEQEIDKKHKEIKVLQKQLTHVETMNKKLLPLQPKADEDVVLQKPQTDLAVKTYLDMVENGSIVTTEELSKNLGITITQDVFSNIAKEAISEYIQVNVTEEQKEKLIEFNNIHGRWPTRTESKTRNILGEYFIRKFAKVSKGYKFEVAIGFGL